MTSAPIFTLSQPVGSAAKAMAGTDNTATHIAAEILFILFPLEDTKVEMSIVDARGNLILQNRCAARH
jgi:hypothetical protein